MCAELIKRTVILGATESKPQPEAGRRACLAGWGCGACCAVRGGSPRLSRHGAPPEAGCGERYGGGESVEVEEDRECDERSGGG